MNIATQPRPGVSQISPWTLTHTGLRMEYMTPTPEMISLEDISHGLGHLCRFTGATAFFYSVAQHSIMVAQRVMAALEAIGEPRTREYWDQAIAALLHDAAEAYVGDIASPLKYAMGGHYIYIEAGIQAAIFRKFDVDLNYLNSAVKMADDKALEYERYYLMPRHDDWPVVEPAGNYGVPHFMDPRTASFAFMEMLSYLLIQRRRVSDG